VSLTGQFRLWANGIANDTAKPDAVAVGSDQKNRRSYKAKLTPAVRIVRVLIGSGGPRNHPSAKFNPSNAP